MKVRDTLIYLILVLNIPALCQVKDIEGNSYKTITIEGNSWFAENLNVSRFKNGDTIPEAKTTEEWTRAGKEGLPIWCYHPTYKSLGKIYNGYAISDPRCLSPEGYDVPSVNFTGSDPVSPYLTTQFLGENYMRLNCFNKDCHKSFSFYRKPGKEIDSMESHGLWWCTDSPEMSFNISRCVGYDGLYFAEELPIDWKSYGFYVRCVKTISKYPICYSLKEAFKIKNETINLFLYNQNITTLNDSVLSLKINKLVIVSVYFSKLKTIPDQINNLTELTSLYLDNNELTTVPGTIGNLKKLQVLNLAYNKIKILPESIGDLINLEYLNLDGNNELKINVDVIGKLKNLKQLNFPSWKLNETEKQKLKLLLPDCNF
jgi:hypothetical protein